MGLQLTLSETNNSLKYEFKDAYWAVMDLSYDTSAVYFRLKAYPSRDSKIAQLTDLPAPTLPVGSQSHPVVSSELYIWEGIFPIVDIFPNGIPISSDEQKTMVYNFIKAYTKLPFEDVYEY